MKLNGIHNIFRKDIPIYYRHEFEADGMFEDRSGESICLRFKFTIEMMPTGEKIISVDLIDTIDYPLLPLVKSLKTEIKRLDSEGKLFD